MKKRQRWTVSHEQPPINNQNETKLNQESPKYEMATIPILHCSFEDTATETCGYKPLRIAQFGNVNLKRNHQNTSETKSQPKWQISTWLGPQKRPPQVQKILLFYSTRLVTCGGLSSGTKPNGKLANQHNKPGLQKT